MSYGNKYFWDHLYILYLTIASYPKFGIKILPSQIINHEFSHKVTLKVPEHFSFASQRLQTFYESSLLTKVGKSVMFDNNYLLKTVTG